MIASELLITVWCGAEDGLSLRASFDAAWRWPPGAVRWRARRARQHGREDRAGTEGQGEGPASGLRPEAGPFTLSFSSSTIFCRALADARRARQQRRLLVGQRQAKASGLSVLSRLKPIFGPTPLTVISSSI